MSADAPHDLKLRASNGSQILVSPAQTDVHFELRPQDSAWIECTATGNPPPRVHWLLAHASQTLNDSAFSSNESRLQLSDASLLAASDTRFVCVATNTYNNRTNTATLNVTVIVTLVIEPQGPLSSQTPERSTPAFGLQFEAKVSCCDTITRAAVDSLDTCGRPSVQLHTFRCGRSARTDSHADCRGGADIQVV